MQGKYREATSRSANSRAGKVRGRPERAARPVRSEGRRRTGIPAGQARYGVRETGRNQITRNTLRKRLTEHGIDPDAVGG